MNDELVHCDAWISLNVLANFKISVNIAANLGHVSEEVADFYNKEIQHEVFTKVSVRQSAILANNIWYRIKKQNRKILHFITNLVRSFKYVLLPR